MRQVTGSLNNSQIMAFDTPALCRVCGAAFTASRPNPRCPACRSPRTIAHAELNELGIAHMDCDAFFAAIEKRDNPALQDKPLIIGGEKRGVVSTACYIARIRGVRSAMPMFKAKKLCPDAVIMKPSMGKYSEAGHAIRTIMQQFTPLVEPLSIDEAFMDLRGTKRLHKKYPAQILIDLSNQIEAEIGITVSIGLSYNKFLAKLASDMEKPRGFTIIGAADAKQRLAPLPVSRIWGVGRVLQKKLEKDGVRTIGQLQTMSEKKLATRYQSMGYRLARLAQGQDSRSINPTSIRKSISTETTFPEDVKNLETLDKTLWRLCEKLSRLCKSKGKAGRTVQLKLKTNHFKSITRAQTLADPTQMAEEIYRIGKLLLHKYCDSQMQSFRLIGIGLSSLTDAEFADPFDLADPDKSRRIATERAIDRLRDRFGDESVKKGRSLL